MYCVAVQFYCKSAVSVNRELGVVICHLYEWSVSGIELLDVDEVVKIVTYVVFTSAVWDGYFHRGVRGFRDNIPA